MLFAKDAFYKAGGFDTAYYPCHDYVLGYQIQRLGYDVWSTVDCLGFYRIASNNVSTNTEIIKEWVKSDFYFREAMYTENIFYKCWGWFMRETQYAKSIDAIYARSLSFNSAVSKHELDFRDEYSTHTIGKQIWRMSWKLYRIFTKKVFR